MLQESAIRKLDLSVARQTGVRFHRLNIGQPDVAHPGPADGRDCGVSSPRSLAYGPASGLPDLPSLAGRRSTMRAGVQGYGRRTRGGHHRGQSEALLFAFTAVCDPGDEILVLEPYYTNYNGFATVAGAVIRPIRTHLSDGFAIPSDEVLDAAVTPRTRAIVFSNPANPTGAVYGKADLERLAAWAARHDLFVIADEVYRRIWFESPPASALELPEHRERVIVVDSFSKTYSACGLRLGFLISHNAAFMEKVERLGQARLGPQPLAQSVGMAALELDEAYYEEIRGTYRERVAALVSALAEVPGVEAPRPAGAFYTMVELPVADTERFARFLVEDFRSGGESVVVAPGGGFYADSAVGARQIRLAAVVEVPVLRRAVEILGEALTAYRATTVA